MYYKKTKHTATAFGAVTIPLVPLLLIWIVYLFSVDVSATQNFADTPTLDYRHYYSSIQQETLSQGNISIEITDRTAVKSTELRLPVVENEELQKDVLKWENERGEITYRFSVKTAGNYYLEMSYLPILSERSSEDLYLGVKIDGEYPFAEAVAMPVTRYWKDERSVTKDLDDNDITPVSIGRLEWTTDTFSPVAGYYNSAYMFNLIEGEHEITLCSEGLNCLVSSLRFVGETYLPAYSQIKPDYAQIRSTPQISVKNDFGEAIVLVEGENPIARSDTALSSTADNSVYHINPSHPSKRRINTVGGGDSWSKNGQALTYEFGVSGSGYYRFTLKVKQSSKLALASTRKIYIDGKVPCEEFQAQEFQYDKSWYKKTLCDDVGDEIYIYLEEGKHTLTFEATAADAGDLALRTLNLLDEIDLTNAEQYINTTNSLAEQLKALRDEYATISQLRGSTGHFDYLIKSLSRSNYITKTDMQGIIDDFKLWLSELEKNPLELDYIEISTVHSSPKPVEKSFFAQLIYNIKMLFGSFFGGGEQAEKEDGVLDIAIYGENDDAAYVTGLVALQKKNNPQFPDVKVRAVSAKLSELVLSGDEPDVYIFADLDETSRLAREGKLTDLSQFTTYYTVTMDRFSTESLSMYSLDEKVYGLPVDEYMPVTFYRKDILTAQGIALPKDWQEFSTVAEILAQKNLSIGVKNDDEADKSDHLYNILLTQTADKALAQDTCTSLSGNVGVENVSAQKFVDGSQPIVIANYNEFSELLSSDMGETVRGLWSYAVVPDEVSPLCSRGVVMTDSTSDIAGGWAFVEWFTSDTVQQQLYTSNMVGNYIPANHHTTELLPMTAASLRRMSAVQNNAIAPQF